MRAYNEKISKQGTASESSAAAVAWRTAHLKRANREEEHLEAKTQPGCWQGPAEASYDVNDTST